MSINPNEKVQIDHFRFITYFLTPHFFITIIFGFIFPLWISAQECEKPNEILNSFSQVEQAYWLEKTKESRKKFENLKETISLVLKELQKNKPQEMLAIILDEKATREALQKYLEENPQVQKKITLDELLTSINRFITHPSFLEGTTDAWAKVALNSWGKSQDIRPASVELSSNLLHELKQVYGPESENLIKHLLQVEVNSLVFTHRALGMFLTFNDHPIKISETLPMFENEKQVPFVIHVNHAKLFFLALCRFVYGSEHLYFYEKMSPKNTNDRETDLMNEWTKAEEIAHFLDAQVRPELIQNEFEDNQQEVLTKIYNIKKVKAEIEAWLFHHPQFLKLVKEWKKERAKEEEVGEGIEKDEKFLRRVIKETLFEDYKYHQVKRLQYFLNEWEIRGKWFATQYLKKYRGLTLQELLNLETYYDLIDEEDEAEKSKLSPEQVQLRETFEFIPHYREIFERLYSDSSPPIDLNPFSDIFRTLTQGSDLSLKERAKWAADFALKFEKREDRKRLVEKLNLLAKEHGKFTEAILQKIMAE